MATRSTRRGGFSLLELLLVMAIVAVVAVMAAPRYASSVQVYRARSAARQVASDIARAQAMARATSAEQRVSVDAAQRRVVLPDLPTADGSTHVTWLDRGAFRSRIAEVDFDGGTELRFDGYGMPSTGGRVVVQTGDVSLAVVVHPVSGQAKVE